MALVNPGTTVRSLELDDPPKGSARLVCAELMCCAATAVELTARLDDTLLASCGSAACPLALGNRIASYVPSVSPLH